MLAIVAAANAGTTINSLRKSDALKCSTALQIEIEDCAVAYCAAPNTEGETITECVCFVLTQFGHLNIGEIREAFRLAAAGKIDVNLNAYHGLFSVRILGDVLGTYADYRAQIAREARAQEEELKSESRADELRKSFDLAKEFAALQAKNTKYARWQDLPYWLCRLVIDRGVLKLTQKEKNEVWTEARGWVLDQLGAWLLNPGLRREDARRYAAARRIVDNYPGSFPKEQLEPEAVEACKKMLVFNHIAPFTGQK